MKNLIFIRFPQNDCMGFEDWQPIMTSLVRNAKKAEDVTVPVSIASRHNANQAKLVANKLRKFQATIAIVPVDTYTHWLNIRHNIRDGMLISDINWKNFNFTPFIQ